MRINIFYDFKLRLNFINCNIQRSAYRQLQLPIRNSQDNDKNRPIKKGCEIKYAYRNWVSLIVHTLFEVEEEHQTCNMQIKP